MSIAPQIPDVCDPMEVETADRSVLIGTIRELERQRSAWELRVRACEEREQLYKMFLNDMGAILAATFQSGHDAVDEQAQRAAKLTEQMALTMARVEDI